MKFFNKQDEIQYKIQNINEGIIRDKIKIIKKNNLSKDKSKSSEQKANWRKNRYKYMKGIKKWHKSTDGKRFHRKLGRTLATRENFIESINNKVPISYNESLAKLFALSSIETHMIIELDFFEPDFESFESFINLLYDFIEITADIKIKLLDSLIEGNISTEVLSDYNEIMFDLVDLKMLKNEVNDMYDIETTIDDFDSFESLSNIINK